MVGGGGAEYDYKSVLGYLNHAEPGATYEPIGNGGLFRRQQALFDHLVDCDEARAYDPRNRRFVDVRAGQR